MSDDAPQPDRLDRLLDEAIDAGRAPDAPDDLRAELDTQLAIDASIRRLFIPTQIADPAAIEMDRLVDEAIDAGRTGAPAIACEVALQRRIDEAVRRLFEPAQAQRERRRWRLSWGWGLAIAAVLTIASATVLYTTGTIGEGWGIDRRDPIVKLYEQQTSSGVVAASCETPEEFQEWVELHFKRSVRPVLDGDEGLTFVGWNYDNLLSDQTVVMVGEARGAGVVVILDRVSADRELPSHEGEGLRVFRREIGDLVFYEVTPLDEAVFLPTFELVEG